MTPAESPRDEPLLDRLSIWARTRPDAPAYTFIDYFADPDGTARQCTWGQLHRQATGMAERLRRVARPGERVALLAPSCLEYVVAMVAAWYAGTIAVPLFAPNLPGQADRLIATYEDCAPACVVTVPACEAEVRKFVAARRHRAAIVVAGGDHPADTGQPAPAGWDDVAYLQYSSGSTRAPAGVEITHGNLTANVTQICETLIGGRERFTGVNWLPLFHDMGLLATVAVPMWAGAEAVFFDPAAFLMQPARWLRLLSGRSAAYTAAPNFAYDYCLRRLGPDELAGLDLRGVFLWLNGAEPVRPATLESFADRLRAAGTGLDENAICPAYGLAEATVFVAADGIDHRPRVTSFDRVELAAGRAVPARVGAGRSTLASCGRPAGQRVAIVDPECAVALPDASVGEIWVHGPNVASRYWRRPGRSVQVFDAALADPVPDGLPAGPWLRTGDLGVLFDGGLYITGRIKDLLIVAGRNHYPQDVEQTVAEAGRALGRVAAFTVLVDERERAIVVAERSRSAEAADWRPGEIARDARRAVWRYHDLALHDIVIAEAGTIPRTTSGKVSRTACRAWYLAGHGAVTARLAATHGGADA